MSCIIKYKYFIKEAIRIDVLKRINELKDERNWTNYKLAIKSNLPQTTVSNLFNRGYEPTISTLESICNGFGITMSEFFNEDFNVDTLEKELLEEISKLTIEEKSALYKFLKVSNLK